MSVYPAPTVHRFSRIRRRANAGRVRPVRHTEDETYEFDMAFKKAKPMEAYEPASVRDMRRAILERFAARNVEREPPGLRAARAAHF